MYYRTIPSRPGYLTHLQLKQIAKDIGLTVDEFIASMKK